jgi:hypothetical protein
MRKFLLHFSLATAVAALTLAYCPSVHAQQADQDSDKTAAHEADPATAQQGQEHEAQMPASGEATTQEAKTFTGRIVKENGDLVLKDQVTEVSYKLSDPAKAKKYVGKQVKVSGKLDLNSNTIQVESIELLS